MININKLKAKLKENAMTQQDMANKIGISSTSFNKKINNKVEFTLSEAMIMCSVLEIDDPIDIFLQSKSQIRNDNVKTKSNKTG